MITALVIIGIRKLIRRWNQKAGKLPKEQPALLATFPQNTQ